MSPTLLLAIYCLLILLASLAGGWVALALHWTHRWMEVAVSFVSGVMLGVALLHLLPHALIEARGSGSIDGVMLWTLAGLLVMFFIERFFCFHHHDVPGDEEAAAGDELHDELEHRDHDHHAGEHHHHHLTWSGAALGLTLHSVIAGVALAAATQVEWEHGGSWRAGLGTFLVIFLHKPFDSLTLGTLMARGGWSSGWRHLVNALFSLAIPVGAAAFLLGVGEAHGSRTLAYALAFSAGTFLCISLSDLLPELQFHQHDRVKLSLALAAGLALAIAVGQLEPHGHEAWEHGAGESAGHLHDAGHAHPPGHAHD